MSVPSVEGEGPREVPVESRLLLRALVHFYRSPFAIKWGVEDWGCQPRYVASDMGRAAAFAVEDLSEDPLKSSRLIQALREAAIDYIGRERYGEIMDMHKAEVARRNGQLASTPVDQRE